MMALSWSIDTSFFLIFLGAALIFIVLGFLNQPRIDYKEDSISSVGSKQKYQSSRRASPGLNDLIEKIRNTVKSSAPAPTQQKARRFVVAVMFFILAVFLIGIIPALFIDAQESEAVDAYQMAEQFRVNGQYDSADVYYRMSLTKDPAYAEALTAYGHSWLAREKYDSAMAQFNRALDTNPGNEDARYGKALTYHYLKNYAQSLKETFRIINNNPEYLDAVVLSGDNYYMQQRYDSAMVFYEDGYQRGERSAGLCHVMAYIYDVKDEPQKAIEFYKETLSYDSTRLEVYNRLGEFFPGSDGDFYRNKVKQLKTEGY